MKRTVLEIACGLAVVVLFASFHQQMARLETQNEQVASLRTFVEEAVSRAPSKAEVERLEKQLAERLTGRAQDLQAKLEDARKGSDEADRLAEELAEARREVANFKVDLRRDVASTRSLVDAYVNEMRSSERIAAADRMATRTAVNALAGTIRRDRNELTKSMLSPTVQLNGDDTVGSGTLIFSGLDPTTGRNSSWVLTSYHVVRNILADTPSAHREGIDVTVYLNDDEITVKGHMMAHRKDIDAAVVKLDTDRVFDNVAQVLDRESGNHVAVWDSIWAVGCPLGNDPVPSAGEISSTSNELDDTNYWMINAPTYFGNSGGGVYLADSKQLIGVFSKIYTHGKGTPIVVPHMGLCTPITSVYDWLEAESLDYLLGESTLAQGLAAPAK